LCYYTAGKEFLADNGAAAAYKEMLKRHNLEISALSTHSNHVHPQKEIADKAHEDFINTCRVKGAIYHFHDKDTKLNMANIHVNGVLDTSRCSDVLDRSWVFRTVGYGHDYLEWKDIISTLAAAGYDSSISIEHEDGLMSVSEGLEKAVSFLRQLIIFEKPGAMWRA